LTGVTVVVVALFRLLWLHINASTMEPFYQV
jgi:cytochrome b561